MPDIEECFISIERYFSETVKPASAFEESFILDMESNLISGKKAVHMLLENIALFSGFMEKKTGEPVRIKEIGSPRIEYWVHPSSVRIQSEYTVPFALAYNGLEFAIGFCAIDRYDQPGQKTQHYYCSFPLPNLGKKRTICPGMESLDRDLIIRELDEKLYPLLSFYGNLEITGMLDEASKKTEDSLRQMLESRGFKVDISRDTAMPEEIRYDNVEDIIYFGKEWRHHSGSMLRFSKGNSEAQFYIPYPGFRHVDKEARIIMCPFSAEPFVMRTYGFDREFVGVWAAINLCSSPEGLKAIISGKAEEYLSLAAAGGRLLNEGRP